MKEENVMKKSFIPLLALLMVVCSCDFVRSVAGRPTSEQLDRLRLEKMAREEAAHRARLDSMERARRHLADSLAALEAHLLDSLSQTRGTVLNPSELGGLFTTKLENRYYIIVGAFRNRAYAERKLKSCNDAGYTATIISFRNGLLSVGVLPSDDLNETHKQLRSLRGSGICPKDGWILVNE